jgi:outer membrane lipoprotein-sorting protein
MIIRKLIAKTAIAFSALSIILPPAIAQTDELPMVAAHLKSVTTMTAAFAQTDRAGKTLNGALTLKRPGKIRFQYEKGVPLLIVGDGRALVFVDYSVRQVQRWPIGNSPLGVLLDSSKDLSRFAKIVPTDNPRVLLAEARDPRHPEYGTTTLAFLRDDSAPGGLMLQGWVTLDSQGNRTSIRLTDQQFNRNISDEAFKWRDPRPTLRGR